MLETYKNILANKFMRDTNYIIIKDTDDIEELQREWDLFQTQMTKKQQEKSDERSIEIWRMTNQEHYETLRDSLIDEFEQTYSTNDDTLEQQDDYEEEEKPEEDDTPKNLVNTSLDDLEIPDDENDITEPMKEDVSNTQKDNIADQFEIDTDINIISTIHGKDTDEMLDNLEKQFTEYNSQSKDHKLRSDDESIAIYNKTNVDRYNDIKEFLLKSRQIENTERVTSTDGKTLKTDTTHHFGEFVSQVYQNMQAVNEAESLKSKQHRRFNDCPYFTPSEMIDMGVYTNGNFYSPFADNDGLITGVRIPLWFDSYKNMCMDHIFEDYRSDWIDTLDKLYSDFEDIKASGNEEKILARKQSILNLGWNPEIAFNRKNRLKASKRVSDILDKTIPKDVFINLDDIPESDDEILSESVSKSTHKPVFLIFTQGSTPIVSQGIKLFTGSEYSHASISFDPELNEVYSFNIREKSGFIRENLSSFGENVISVMTFFAPNKIVQQLKDKVKDFEDNKTTFDLRIFLNKILHIDHKVSKNEYHQVCSTFVDTVLKSGSINLTGDINIPDPGQLYDHAKSMPNKIIEVFNDKAPKYDGKKTKRKLTTLLKSSDIEGIEESSNKSMQPYYRVTYNGIGIYEELKKEMYKINYDSSEWKKFKQSNACNWLPLPPSYCDGYYSYFTKLGYDKFMKSTYPVITKYLDKDTINIEQCYIDKNSIIYQDNYQIVIDSSKNEFVKESTINNKEGDIMFEWVQDVRNGVNPFSKKTFYHISFDSDLDEHGPLKPRIPSWITNKLKKDENFLKVLEKARTEDVGAGTGFEEYKTPRVCFSNSIEGCLNAIINDTDRLKLAGETLYVYTPEKPISEYKHKTNKQILKDGDIFDANITNEMWILEPVNLKYVGSIVVDKVTNEHVKKFANDKNRSIIKYDYKWHWFHKIKKHHINESTPILNEACKDIKSAREFVSKVGELAKKYDANYFIVTDGASGIHNNGNPAVKNARDSQIKWEKKHGFDPDEDWSKKSIKEVTLPTGVTLRNATKDDTDNMFKWEMESVDKGIRNDPKVIKYIEKDVQDSIKITKMIMYKDETIGMFTTDRLEPGSDYWYIGEIYIVKEYRNKGIGTALLKDEISKHDKIKLQVAQSNHGAMKLYKSLGFEITDRNDEGKLYIMTLDKKEKSIKEQTSIFNEVKQFPIEFDKDGNLIIYKARTGTLAFGDEIDDSVQLLESYRNQSNIEGMKYEIAKLWYINDCIEKKLKKRLSNDQYKELIDNRSVCLNSFKYNLEYIMKYEKGFNFSDYYNSTPFSDNSVKITSNTIDYTIKTIKGIL